MMATPLRVVLADDEPVARQRLRRMLSAEPDLTIIGEAKNGREALAIITEQRPDVVFMDIRMPVMDGMAVVAALPQDALPYVIFVTASDSHAVSAFAMHALDYVVKPVEARRLKQAVDRARQTHVVAEQLERYGRLRALLRAEAAADDADAAHPVHQPVQSHAVVPRFLIRENGRRFFVPAEQIAWLESYGNYVRLHGGGKTYLQRTTMARIEALLDPSHFARIHRSYIVNLAAVQEVQPWFTGDYLVILKDGTRLRLSRTYRDRFAQRGLV